MPPVFRKKQWLKTRNGLGHFFLGVRMSTQGLTKAERKERAKRALQWLQLRKDNLLSQVRAADVLNISRRRLQSIEARTVRPRLSTLIAFRDYSEKLARERKREGQRDSGWAE
jgi:hypothetical protein